MTEGKSIKTGSSLDCKIVTGATEKSQAVVLCTVFEPAKKVVAKSYWQFQGIAE